jgi:glycosyltransferase involved in cell wall biosynthesis
MKVTYIVSGIKRSLFFENTALELVKKGFSLDFILISNLNDEFGSFLKKNNFAYTEIGLKNFLSYPRCIRQIRRILKNNRPDIVHTHLTSANIIGLTAARLAGIRNRLYTRHSGKTLKGDWKTKLYDRITKMNTNFTIANTGMVKELLLKEGYRDDKVEVIHYGFNLERFGHNDEAEVKRLNGQYNPANRHPVIGMISRCVEWKGIQYAVPAFEKLLAEYPNALLCLFNFSDKEDFSKIVNVQLQRLPKGSYIKVPFENNVFDLYQLFDLFVHVPIDPYYEAFGQVYVEALAAGIPSVFTLSGIANDFVENEQQSLVVKYKDPESIHAALRRLLEDPALRERLKRNGTEIVNEKFTIEPYITKLATLYQKLYQQYGS